MMKKNEKKKEKEKAADKCVFVWWMSQGDVDTDACPLLYLQRFELCTLSIVWRVHTHTSGQMFQPRFWNDVRIYLFLW